MYLIFFSHITTYEKTKRTENASYENETKLDIMCNYGLRSVGRSGLTSAAGDSSSASRPCTTTRAWGTVKPTRSRGSLRPGATWNIAW